MNAVQAAIGTDPKRLWVLIAVLEMFPACAPVASKMREMLRLRGLGQIHGVCRLFRVDNYSSVVVCCFIFFTVQPTPSAEQGLLLAYLMIAYQYIVELAQEGI